MTILDQLISDGIIQIYIEGGEPLTKPGIIPLITRASRDTMTLLRTHGTLIDEEMADLLKAAGIGRVLVDLMGADAITHENATGVSGSFVAACDAIRRLVAREIPTDVLVVLTKYTAPGLGSLMRTAHDLGAQRVGILRLYPLGRAKRIWSDIALSLEEQMAVIRNLTPPPGLGVMQSWHPYDKNCCWQAAAINAFGRAIGCMYLREYVDYGDVTSTRYIDIWAQNALYRQLRAGSVERSCSECSAGEGTAGGCRATAYAFSGRWDAPDPFDEAINDGVDLRVLPQ
jgi:radical SAM protein with 4Fe4S-binding SPASM domain